MFDLLRKRPPEKIILEKDAVHVWLVPVNPDCVSALENIISNDERARAAGFHSSKHKTEYTASRIQLRIILSKYTGTSPHRLRFDYNEYGKPAISGKANGDLKFNLSHSGGLALYAFAHNREIGVDLEMIDAPPIDRELAVKVLTTRELAFFNELETNQRTLFFYKCWTRKEAYLKATGRGLLSDPNAIETFYLPAEPDSESKTDQIYSKTLNHSIIDLPSIAGFTASLALEGINDAEVKCWRA